MERLLAAPLTVLHKLYFPLHGFPVLGRVIIAPLADRATERDQFVSTFHLGHGEYNSAPPHILQPVRPL